MEKVANFFVKERKKKALWAIILAGIFLIASFFILSVIFTILTIMSLFFGSILFLQETFSKNKDTFNITKLKIRLLLSMFIFLIIHRNYVFY